MPRRRDHAEMLADAVIVERGRTRVMANHRPCRGGVVGHMRAARDLGQVRADPLAECLGHLDVARRARGGVPAAG